MKLMTIWRTSPLGPRLLSVMGKRRLRSRPSLIRENDMPNQRDFKHQPPLQDRLTAWSDEVRKQAARLPRGPEREVLLAKARQADAAFHLEKWLHSPPLQPPKRTLTSIRTHYGQPGHEGSA